jgi:hypothetical protein
MNLPVSRVRNDLNKILVPILREELDMIPVAGVEVIADPNPPKKDSGQTRMRDDPSPDRSRRKRRRWLRYMISGDLQIPEYLFDGDDDLLHDELTAMLSTRLPAAIRGDLERRAKTSEINVVFQPHVIAIFLDDESNMRHVQIKINVGIEDRH